MVQSFFFLSYLDVAVDTYSTDGYTGKLVTGNRIRVYDTLTVRLDGIRFSVGTGKYTPLHWTIPKASNNQEVDLKPHQFNETRNGVMAS